MILGCSFDEFKSHIEKQFLEGMSWGNRDKWHIDHILPVSMAKNEKELLELKTISEKLTNEKYNSCLLNLYHNGSEGMAYHSDDEKALKKNLEKKSKRDKERHKKNEKLKK